MKAFSTTTLWIALAFVSPGCGARSYSVTEPVVGVEEMIEQQIESRLTMAALLDHVVDRKTSEEARPIMEEWKIASQSLEQILVLLPSSQTSDLKKRFAARLSAADERLAKALEDSKRRVNNQLPEIKSIK